MKKSKIIFSIIILCVVGLAVFFVFNTFFMSKSIMDRFKINIDSITSIEIQKGMSDHITTVSDEKAVKEIVSHLNSVKIRYLEKNDTLGFNCKLSFYKDDKLLKTIWIINPKTVDSSKYTYQAVGQELDLSVIEKYIK